MTILVLLQYIIMHIYYSISGNLLLLDFYIEYNIAATKSLFAATTDISVLQCHLDLRESLIV